MIVDNRKIIEKILNEFNFIWPTFTPPLKCLIEIRNGLLNSWLSIGLSTLTERAVVLNKTYINLTQPSFARQFRREIGADSGVQVVEPIYRVQNQIMIPTTSLSHHQTPNKEKIETLKGNWN